MKSYDLYLFDEEQKAVIGWHSFEQENDKDALKYAQTLAQRAPMELWEGEKLIGSWAQSK